MHKFKLRSLLKKLIIERNLKIQQPLSAYICGIDTESNGIFKKICREDLYTYILQEESVSNPLGCMFVYEKNRNIFNKINENSIEILEKEINCKEKEKFFDDDYPIFIVRNIGDLDMKDKNIFNLESNIDWIIHDLFHFIFDYSWLINKFKIKLNEELSYFLEKAGFKFGGLQDFKEIDKFLQKDSIIFLKNNSFTNGVGESDYYASIAAFTILNREKSELNEKDIEGLTYKQLFKEFYSIVYDYSYTLFEEICKSLKNKIICLGVNQ